MKEKDLYEDTLFVFSADNGWRPDPETGRLVCPRSKKDTGRGREFAHRSSSPTRTILHPVVIRTTLASNIDIAPTILKACGIEPDKAMSGLDLRKPEVLAERDRIFVDLYWDNIRVDALDDLDSDLIARVVVDGWDKLIVRPDSLELYDLKNDPDDRTDLAAQNPEKVQELSGLMSDWLEATPIVFPPAP